MVHIQLCVNKDWISRAAIIICNSYKWLKKGKLTPVDELGYKNYVASALNK